VRVLGIDPGATGALAIVEDLALVALHDMPTFEVTRGKGKRREVDVRALAGVLAESDVAAIYMEKVGGTTKDDARRMATDLWPGHAPDFARKKDDGRADAALIAEYGRRELASQGVFA